MNCSCAYLSTRLDNKRPPEQEWAAGRLSNRLITPHTVLWECCKDDQQLTSMGNTIFRSLPAPKSLDRFSKKLCTVDYVGDPTPHASVGVSRFKVDMSAHAWNCHPQASIFLFFKVPCASLQIGPLDLSSPLTAQMTLPCGVHVLFMVSLIKSYFSLFSPQNVKNCITHYGNFEEL